MMKSPKISVIIPTRNRHELLHRAVTSVLNQSFKDYEVIIVDNNSEHNRVEISESLLSLLHHSNIRIIPARDAGNAAQVRNIGLNHARGKWITFLDDDDAYRPDKLEKQLALARESSSPLVLCGLCYHLSGRTRNVQCEKAMHDSWNWIGKLNPATPAFFHLNNHGVLFDKNLSAFEDFVYFYDLLEFFGVEKIPSVTSPLIDVYIQQNRVNINDQAIWRASRMIHAKLRKSGQFATASQFALLTWISVNKSQKSSWIRYLKFCAIYLRRYGWKNHRFIFNSLAFRIPFLRRFLVQ